MIAGDVYEWRHCHPSSTDELQSVTTTKSSRWVPPANKNISNTRQQRLKMPRNSADPRIFGCRSNIWALLLLMATPLCSASSSSVSQHGRRTLQRGIRSTADAINEGPSTREKWEGFARPAPDTRVFPALARGCTDRPHLRYVPVRTTLELQRAMNESLPGDLIHVRPGTYNRAPFFNLTIADKQGTATNRITICGPRRAIITGAGNYANKPYIFHIKSCRYVTLAGMRLMRGFMGVIVEYSRNVVLDLLEVSLTDFEAVHLRYDTSDSIVQRCKITNTGQTDPGKGEGVYIGSAARFGVDQSNNNKILRNRIGPGVTAEMIDVKENTVGGLIEGNIFDGSGLSGINYADSWVDIKGSGWVIRGNVGTITLLDGFVTHDLDPPLSGEYNVFENNTCNGVNSPGYCVRIYCDFGKELCHNTVKCDNQVVGGTAAISNLACTP